MRQNSVIGWGCLFLLTACSEALPPEVDPGEAQPGQEIRVAGVVAPSLSVQVQTKALAETPAEEVTWLKTPLTEGLDVFYGLKEEYTTTRVMAELKWIEASKEYTFRYKSDQDQNARWLGNGAHLFRGVYVPPSVRSAGETAPASRPWVNNQSPETGDGAGEKTNYDHLKHYLAMRANLQIAATLGRIQLPYQHRLARVLTVVLIDPKLGDGVTLKGYKFDETTQKDDPTSTQLRMDQVQVLDYAKEGLSEKADVNHTSATVWCPQWTEARQVIPHFLQVMGSLDNEFKELDPDMLVFQDKRTDTYYYPTSIGWPLLKEYYEGFYNTYMKQHPTATVAQAEAYAETQSRVVRTNYGKAPCYDLIIRPTYTSPTMVMYDERYNGKGVDDEKGDEVRNQLAALKNAITYKLKLSNGLMYDKRVEVDLDAGYQSVVYLRIDREKVDFSQTVAEQWVVDGGEDDYYGVNNAHGDRLSIAGGSWQRAFRINDSPGISADITDGSHYKEDGIPDHLQKPDGHGRDGQYLSEEKWKTAFLQAKEGGEHHGDYFVLTSDITLDVSQLKDFVFTGHLDGRGHTITLTGSLPAEGTDTDTGTDTGGSTPETPDTNAGADAGTGSTGSPEGTGSEGAGEGGSTTPSTPAAPAIRYLFAGLNGTYDAAVGTANVHLKNGIEIPQKGYRAEVMNVVVKGGVLFKPEVWEKRNDADSAITGYVLGCSDDISAVVDQVPVLTDPVLAREK